MASTLHGEGREGARPIERKRALMPTHGRPSHLHVDPAGDLAIVERKQTDSGVISASRVREMLGRGDFATLAGYVPPTTLTYLQSDAAEPIRQRLQQDYRNTPLSGS